MMASRTIAALLLFGLVNLIWGQLGVGKLAADDFPFDTWTGCAIKDYLRVRKSAPDIAFLGSSLVLFPAGQVDADMLNREIDAPRHHRSLYFERKFADASGRKPDTFDFALPGEMPSDAYFITKFLFKDARQPRVIVYGTGPRDYMDNCLPYPSATDPFHHISHMGDISQHISIVSPDWQDRLNWELGRLCFPYGKKTDLSLSFERMFTDRVVSHLVEGVPPISFDLKHQLLPDYKVTEVGETDCRFRPYVDRARPPFVDNLAEYRKRYKVLKWDTFLTQMEFLAQTMDVARSRGIEFVLVSMPITQLNRDLIDPVAMRAFRHSLKALAQVKGATFIDLDSSKDYQLSDFEDTVHLHSGGGRKMLSALASQLAANSQVRSALAVASQTTAEEAFNLQESRSSVGIKSSRIKNGLQVGTTSGARIQPTTKPIAAAQTATQSAKSAALPHGSRVPAQPAITARDRGAQHLATRKESSL